MVCNPRGAWTTGTGSSRTSNSVLAGWSTYERRRFFCQGRDPGRPDPEGDLAAFLHRIQGGQTRSIIIESARPPVSTPSRPGGKAITSPREMLPPPAAALRKRHVPKDDDTAPAAIETIGQALKRLGLMAGPTKTISIAPLWRRPRPHSSANWPQRGGQAIRLSR